MTALSTPKRKSGMIHPSFIPYRQAASFLLSKLEAENTAPPLIGIICGSGLSGLSSSMTSTTKIMYSEIPGFPHECSVAGHKNELVFGLLSNTPAVCFRGRFHFYEGHDMDTVALPARVMRAMGVKVLFVTNAAGGLNPSYSVGDVIVITDHLALPMLGGQNPLRGPNDEEMGPRFPPTSNAYDEELRSLALDSAKKLGFQDFVRSEGTYCFVSGPMYESKAECKFLRSAGGDAVGMSTMPELVTAHHSGMKILCLSVITNKVIASGDEGPAASHQEVLDAIKKRSTQLQTLMQEIVRSSSGFIEKLPALPAISLDIGSDQDVNEKKNSDISYIRADYMAMIALGVIGTLFLKRTS